MDKDRKLEPIIIACMIFLLYTIAAIYKVDLLGNILAPIMDLVVFVLIFRNVFEKKQARMVRAEWICLSAGILSWTFADAAWCFYLYYLGIDPETSRLIEYSYMLTNLFFTIQLAIFAKAQFKKWNGIQLILDSVAIASAVLFLVWISFFQSAVSLEGILAGEITALISFALNITGMAGIFIWSFSVRKGRVPKHVAMIATGVFLYYMADLYYYNVYFSGTYIPNSIVDVLYAASFLIIAIGSVLWRYGLGQENGYTGEKAVSNIGFRRKGFLLFIFPILMLLVEGFVVRDLLIFLSIMLFHESVTTYVQGYAQNEILLKKEKEMNRMLEEKIQQRTKEIIAKNQELEGKNRELDFLSNQDTVTNLYNRRYFMNALESECTSLKQGETIGLMFIDVDRFKTINDTYGHYIGDELLISLSKRLQSLCTDNVLLARMGGDEFVLRYRGSYGYQELEEFARAISSECGKTIEVEQYAFQVSMSIGISLYPVDAKDFQTLLKNADIAMYQAKACGHGNCVSYDINFTNKLRHKNDIEILLKQADFEKDFEVFYQPQFSIPHKKLVGIEALLRWNNLEMGYISPAEFIPIAEEISYINPIGEWVMGKAIRQISIWNEMYDIDLKVGINVSPVQLENKTMIPALADLMRKYAVRPENIDIEITESIAIEGEHKIKQIDTLFEGLGVSISVDDFGTGYSSLSYLKHFPFERIKIAKPLVDAIAYANYDMQIVKSIIQLAKSIGMKTIAEGVETQEQFDILAELGCDEIQGFLLGKPVPADEFEVCYFGQACNKERKKDSKRNVIHILPAYHEGGGADSNALAEM